MKLIVGLGNPGPKYEHTRHNVGFMAADEIVRRHGFRGWRDKFSGALAEGEIAGERTLVLKPMTFMNDSGKSVGPMAQFYKITPADVMVIHDELDLAPGKVRVKRGGGAAGHNGLRSIDQHLGNDYWRIRVGIGHPGARELVLSYVLQNFAVEDAAWLEPLLPAMAEAMPLIVEGKESQFMSKIGVLTEPAAQGKK